MNGTSMTRSERNELLVKFACAALEGCVTLATVDERVIKDVWWIADMMLAEYEKRQPVARAFPDITPPTPEERAEVARIIEQYKAELAMDEPRVCPEIARNLGT